MTQDSSSRNQWQLGKLFGIPLLIDSSWLLIVALVTVSNAIAWQSEFPAWGVTLTWTAGFAMAILLFASVLLHELGHSLVAKARGIQVNSITLFLFGGIASLEQEAKTPETTFLIAIAGPLVSLGLWLGLGWVAHFSTDASAAHILFQDLASINLILVLFNMIPGLPLDGGHVLKAAIWRATGNRFLGSHWAARVGQTLGWSALILG
ncbi:MAG: site-2 protease family protein, partial [Cyanobacteria bacterium P01_F01_bin.42]